MDAPPTPESDITFESIGRGYTPMDDSMDDRFSVPTLEELGIDRFSFVSPIFFLNICYLLIAVRF